MSADIGLIGLAVMGQNLVLNMNDHGFKVAVHNRSAGKTDDLVIIANILPHINV
jgi:6-phosphogluconate dehydrogenase